MDVTQIKKINEMAKAMKDHGLQENVEKNPEVEKELNGGHGVKIIEKEPEEEVPTSESETQIIRDEPVEENASVQEAPVEEKTEEVKSEELASQPEAKGVTEDYVYQKIQENNNNFIQAIEMLKKNVQQLNQKIEDLKADCERNKKVVVQESQSQTQLNTNEKSANDESADKRKENSNIDNPSDFKDDDVSVEKMFYYGNK